MADRGREVSLELVARVLGIVDREGKTFRSGLLVGMRGCFESLLSLVIV